MDPAKRIITQIPLQELWDDSGVIQAREDRDLSSEMIRALLREGPVRFMVADVGAKPGWIPATETFGFWKDEVKPHFVQPGQRVRRQDFRGEYCYFASEWRGDNGECIIVLTRSH